MAVIATLDDDLIGLVIGIQPDRARTGLPAAVRIAVLFNSVSDCITNQMSEWLGDSVENAFVDQYFRP